MVHDEAEEYNQKYHRGQETKHYDPDSYTKIPTRLLDKILAQDKPLTDADRRELVDCLQQP